MSGAPRARVCAARVRRRARRYFMTGQPVVLPKALARCERETLHASATAGKVSSPDELRSMTHNALSTTDMHTRYQSAPAARLIVRPAMSLCKSTETLPKVSDRSECLD